MKRLLQRSLSRLGIQFISRNSPLFGEVPGHLEPAFRQIQRACAPFTMTTWECMYSLFRAVGYVVRSGIPGDIVECGVFQGGSIMVCAHSLHCFEDDSRRLYLYDTFEGMTEPTSRDVDFMGRTPHEHVKTWGLAQLSEMAACSLEQVRRNLSSCPYPQDKFVFVKGPVEQTIPATIPDQIAVLRLDTDWYESTRHELVHLFPRLVRGGVLIVDDYGIWRGAREAVDEYFRHNSVHMLLNLIDRSGASIGVKS